MQTNILNFFRFWALDYSSTIFKYRRCNYAWKSKEYIQIFIDVLFHHKAK